MMDHAMLRGYSVPDEWARWATGFVGRNGVLRVAVGKAA
jgi:hypothetical protein